MPCTPDDSELLQCFNTEYRLGQAEIMRRIERSVCGCDYGGTSWTTRREAEEVGERLNLRPGTRLLEVGAGSGWPGLYLAGVTGCDVVLLDLPFEGLRIAAERAARDGLAETARVVLGDGTALPLRDVWFDAIFHSDVLCCLQDKLSVLVECRRTVRPGGHMMFTVISIAPGLSSADYARATACGPPFIEAPADYSALLHRAGWAMTARIDMTAQYAKSLRQLLNEEQAHEGELTDLLGEEDYASRLTRRQNSLGAIEQGLLRREMFGATPAAP